MPIDDTAVEPLWDEPEAPEPEMAVSSDATVRMDAAQVLGLAAELLAEAEQPHVPSHWAGPFEPEPEEVAEPEPEEPAAGPDLEGVTRELGAEELAELAELEPEEGEAGAGEVDAATEAELEPEPEPEPEPEHEAEPARDLDTSQMTQRMDEAELEATHATHASQGFSDGSQPVIDVGDDDAVFASQGVQGFVTHSNAWHGATRASERSQGFPMWLVALLATGAVVAGFLIAYNTLGLGGSDQQDTSAVVRATSKDVPVDEAQRVISSLDGWWKTGRMLDGRYWHLEGGLMETYAADGRIASQVLLDPTSIVHMSSGPGEIEGSGYYLKDIAYYLLDSDPDTLHALGGDGAADEDANLLRSDPPAFVTVTGVSGTDVPEVVEGDESEYMLPESNTRVYDASELEPLSDHDLFIARNEIYARHGYVFDAGELSEYFGSKSWYLTSDVFSEGELNEIERTNVSTILAIEQARGSRYV